MTNKTMQFLIEFIFQFFLDPLNTWLTKKQHLNNEMPVWRHSMIITKENLNFWWKLQSIKKGNMSIEQYIRKSKDLINHILAIEDQLGDQ